MGRQTLVVVLFPGFRKSAHLSAVLLLFRACADDPCEAGRLGARRFAGAASPLIANATTGQLGFAGRICTHMPQL